MVCSAVTSGLRLLDFDTAVIQATDMPEFFEISFELLAPTLGSGHNILSVEDPVAGSVIALFTTSTRLLQLSYNGGSLTGPQILPDFATSWTVITIKYTSAGNIRVSTPQMSSSFTYSVAEHGELPTPPWSPLLMFSNSYDPSSGGYVRNVQVSGNVFTFDHVLFFA
jgi:hypothetical protein